MTVELLDVRPPCVDAPEMFADDAVHAAAHRECAKCPMMVDCLYRAVVEVDVSGFVACTTEADRARIRRTLGVTVSDPSADLGIALARVARAPVSHEAVLQARAAYPHDTCQQLANRLDCSTSTIKRHLRRARTASAEEAALAASGRTRVKRPNPSVDEVLDVFDSLVPSQR